MDLPDKITAFVYPQAPRRITELAFELCDRATIAKIEQTFIDRRGRAVTLWVPTFRNDIDLITALPTAGDARYIQVDSTSRYLDTTFTTHPGYPYLCLNDNSGQPIFPFKIAALHGEYLFCNVPITQAFAKSAKISSLILSRFQESQIQWTYHTDGYADTTIKFVEETEDYAAVPVHRIKNMSRKCTISIILIRQEPPSGGTQVLNQLFRYQG